jgi:hypothetical protein
MIHTTQIGFWQKYISHMAIRTFEFEENREEVSNKLIYSGSD